MYEAQFHLKRRPFAATPDPRCFLSAGPIQAALDELVVCVEQGQGVAVVSAPAGTGKTLLCERLRAELEHHFEIVFLAHASFLTRRALLQTILADLNHVYRRHDEQELRLELVPAIRALKPHRQALVLICDEAHKLTEDLLEELRILSDLSDRGTPLVRLVLVGQPSLEETLACPALEALNQRIRAQVCLEPFDHAASVDYIDYRITWAGGRMTEVFTPEAIELVCRASQGIPRCINQLCDHALLLAYVAEETPVSAETVREALKDLRQLPLHWNETLTESVSDSSPVTTQAVEYGSFDSVEFGADLPMSAEVEHIDDADEPAWDLGLRRLDREMEVTQRQSQQVVSAETVDWQADSQADELPHTESDTQTHMIVNSPIEAGSPVDVGPPEGKDQSRVVEEIVWDRYAAIDGGFSITEVPESRISSPAASAEITKVVEVQSDTESSDQVHWEPQLVGDVSLAPTLDEEENVEVDQFETVCARLDGMLQKVPEEHGWDSPSLHEVSELEVESQPSDEDCLEASLGQAVCQLVGDVREELVGAHEVSSTCEQLRAILGQGSTESTSMEFGTADGASERIPVPARDPERPYRNLFSQLRRKQQGLL